MPRGALPSVVAGVLTESHGRVVTEQEIWPHLPVSARVHAAATDGLAETWTSRSGLELLGAVQSTSGAAVRRFFALSGPDLLGAARRWNDGGGALLPERRSGTGEVTSELIEYFGNDAAALRRLDDGHGRFLVQGLVRHQLVLGVDLLRNSRYSAQDGRALASVVGHLAQLAGWLHFDLDDHGEAQRLYLLGLRAAGLAGDRQLGSMILSALASQQTWRNRPADAVALLTTAAAGLPAGASPRVRSILAMRRARAHAMVGDEPEARAAIARAEDGLDRGPGDDTPVWAYWLNHTVLTNEIGRCLLDLGQPKGAREHLDRGGGLLGDQSSRDRILYGLSLAEAHRATAGSDDGGIERACHEASMVLPMMATVTSVRCRMLLGSVVEGLRAYRTACVRDLRDQAGAVLIGRT